MAVNDEGYLSLAQTILSSCFENYGASSDLLSVKSPDTTGDGYVGTLLFVKVNYKNQVHNIAIKCSPQDEEKRRVIEPEQLFKTEAYFYTVFYPAITEYQNKTIGRQIFSSVTHCYGTYFEQQMEALALQDVSENGYQMCKLKDVLDENHIRMVLEELGKLHAISFAFHQQDPEKFENLTASLRTQDVFADVCHRVGLINAMNHLIQNTVRLLRSKGGRCEEYAEKLNEFAKEAPGLIECADSKSQYSVVLHGDCWRNNMMFKYEPNSSEPTRLCFLDFQLCRIDSPLIDFSYFFYCSASKHVLNEVDKYLQIYYDSLSNTMRQLGANPEELFPFDIFKEHWRKYSKLGLAVSFVIYKLILCKKEEAPEMNSDFADHLKTSIENEKAYNDRIVDIVTHFVEYGLI